MRTLATVILATFLAVACSPPAEDNPKCNNKHVFVDGDHLDLVDGAWSIHSAATEIAAAPVPPPDIVLQGDFDTEPSRTIPLGEFVGGLGISDGALSGSGGPLPNYAKIYCTREHVVRDGLGDIIRFETEGPYGQLSVEGR